MYDPVYGLPLVQDVAKYGEVLRDMREGRVKEVLWFSRQRSDVPQLKAFEGRCVGICRAWLAWIGCANQMRSCPCCKGAVLAHANAGVVVLVHMSCSWCSHCMHSCAA